MVSLNCQSINAKSDQLKLFLADINSDSPISVIYIQETWGHEGINMTAFSLPNYAMVYENRLLTAHGGLMIYIHDEFHYRNFNRDIEITNTSDLFESLIVEIWRKNNKYQKCLIGNIYRLPNYTGQYIDNFAEQYVDLLHNLRNQSKFIYLCGDYNIDLLKINSNENYNIFYENASAAGFVPKIILPTRICDTASPLIDKVYTNALDKSHISGILIQPISDHQLYFCIMDETYAKGINNRKNIEVEKLTNETISNYKKEIENSDVYNKLDKQMSAI